VIFDGVHVGAGAVIERIDQFGFGPASVLRAMIRDGVIGRRAADIGGASGTDTRRTGVAGGPPIPDGGISYSNGTLSDFGAGLAVRLATVSAPKSPLAR